MADWHSMRASDADRERAADLLKAAMAEGRLSWDEYRTRLDRLMATRDYGEIYQVIGDLPSGVAPFPTVSAPPRHITSDLAHHVAAPSPPADPLATASAICGVLVPFTCGLTAIPAIVTGHLARSRLRYTNDPGKGLAVAGLILGYLPVVAILAVVFFFLVVL